MLMAILFLQLAIQDKYPNCRKSYILVAHILLRGCRETFVDIENLEGIN